MKIPRREILIRKQSSQATPPNRETLEKIRIQQNCAQYVHNVSVNFFFQKEAIEFHKDNMELS